MKIVCKGYNYSIYVDGIEYISIFDDKKGFGSIGLRTNKAVAYYYGVYVYDV